MKLANPETQEGDSNSPFHKVAECLYRHSSSEIYYALVKRGGKQFRRSLKTTDRQLANRRLSEFRDKIGRMSQTKNASHILFGDVASRWLEKLKPTLKDASARRRETSVNQLNKFFKGSLIRSLAKRDCENWVIERSKKASPSTFNNELGTLKGIFDYARRDGLLLDNPAEDIQRLKPKKGKIMPPSREQFRKLVETIRKCDCRAWEGADLVELLAYSGMRLAEATALTWGDVDFERDVFTVTGGDVGTKNHEARTVPLFPAFRSLLERLRGDKTPEPNERVIKIGTARKAIDNACVNAKLPHFSHHSMRHYFVSNAIEAGIDFKVIAGWVGHKDGGVLVAETYGHLRDSHSFEMAKRMTFDRH